MNATEGILALVGDQGLNTDIDRVVAAAGLRVVRVDDPIQPPGLDGRGGGSGGLRGGAALRRSRPASPRASGADQRVGA